MKRIDAYITDDNTLFRSECDAKRHETTQKLKIKLKYALSSFDGIIDAEDLYQFIEKNRDLMMEILAVDWDYTDGWVYW